MSKVQLGFYYDQTRCMTCNACSVACKDWNQVEPGAVRYREAVTYETKDGFFPLSMGCNHCEEPACEAMCPEGAITKDERGVVTIHRNQCVEAGGCAIGCPFGKPMFAEDKQEPVKKSTWQVAHPAQKCTFCIDRIAQGERPACVAACVGRALDCGDMKVLAEKYPDAVRLNPTDFPYAYTNNTDDTKPSLLIKKKPATLRVHKAKNYTGRIV